MKSLFKQIFMHLYVFDIYCNKIIYICIVICLRKLLRMCRCNLSDGGGGGGGGDGGAGAVEADAAFNVWQRSARYFYHTYLTLFMRTCVNRQERGGGGGGRGSDMGGRGSGPGGREGLNPLCSHKYLVREWLHLSLHMFQEKGIKNSYSSHREGMADCSHKAWHGHGHRHRHRPEYHKSYDNIKNGHENGENEYLNCVKMILANPDVYEWDPLDTAVLCDAYGCYKEVTDVCRLYLMRSFKDNRELKVDDSAADLKIKCFLVRCLTAGVSSLMEGVIMNHVSGSTTVDKMDSDTVTGGVRGDRVSSDGEGEGALGSLRAEVVAAVRLMWVILARDVVVRRGVASRREGEGGALIDWAVKELAETMLSSSICPCFLPFTASQEGEAKQEGEGERERGAVLDLINEILRKENYPNTDKVLVLPLERLFSDSCIHSSSVQINDTYKTKYSEVLESIRATVASEVSHCLLSALGAALASRTIEVFPETVSDYLDIDFICQLI